MTVALQTIRQDVSSLGEILQNYEQALEEAESIIRLEGKNLEQANKENPIWQVYFDQKAVELDTIVKFLDMKVEQTRSRLYKTYRENYSRELTEREINRYIDGESKYLTMYELYLEARELLLKFQKVCEAFRSRGYALNNITKIRVANLEDTVI